jgi:hypothetical protein
LKNVELGGLPSSFRCWAVLRFQAEAMLKKARKAGPAKSLGCAVGTVCLVAWLDIRNASYGQYTP